MNFDFVFFVGLNIAYREVEILRIVTRVIVRIEQHLISLVNLGLDFPDLEQIAAFVVPVELEEGLPLAARPVLERRLQIRQSAHQQNLFPVLHRDLDNLRLNLLLELEQLLLRFVAAERSLRVKITLAFCQQVLRNLNHLHAFLVLLVLQDVVSEVGHSQRVSAEFLAVFIEQDRRLAEGRRLRVLVAKPAEGQHVLFQPACCLCE